MRASHSVLTSGVDGPRQLEEFAEGADARLAPAGVARLVPEVPEEDARVVAVAGQQLLAHREELRLQVGIVHLRVAHFAGEAAVLAELASAVVADVERLGARFREPPHRLGPHAVVAQHDDRPHPVARHDGEAALEALQEAVVLLQPHAEPLELHQDAQRVEADGLRHLQLALHLGEPLLGAERLPLVHAVGAARRHVVAAADPRLGVIPCPGLFARPGAGAGRGGPGRFISQCFQFA